VDGRQNAAHNKAAALNNLARNYREKQQFDKAEPLMKQAVDVLVADPTANPADVIIAVDNLAMVYRELGDYKSAEAQYRKALELQKGIAGAKPSGCSRSHAKPSFGLVAPI
jgi:tetratricopeptide (TPR) repeat protein